MFWHWTFLFASFHSSRINSIRFLSCDECRTERKRVWGILGKKRWSVCESVIFLTKFIVDYLIHSHCLNPSFTTLNWLSNVSISANISRFFFLQIFNIWLRILNSHHLIDAKVLFVRGGLTKLLLNLSGTNSIDHCFLNYSSIRWKCTTTSLRQRRSETNFFSENFSFRLRTEAKRLW